MKKFKKKRVQQEVLVKTTCDRCGKVKKEGDWHTPDLLSFRQSFGYGSDYDQDEISFDLCEKCLFEMLKDSGVKYRLKFNTEI